MNYCKRECGICPKCRTKASFEALRDVREARKPHYTCKHGVSCRTAYDCKKCMSEIR